MPSIWVESLRFDIHSNFDGHKYDDWVHYRSVLEPQGSYKAVDLVVARFQMSPPEVWLVEAKDYRVINNPPERSNLEELPETMAKKVGDTLRGLADASQSAEQENEKALAIRAMSARSRKVVLHLEPHVGQHSTLFPKNFSANVLQKLKQLVREIDPNPLVLDIARTPRARVPWGVS